MIRRTLFSLLATAAVLCLCILTAVAHAGRTDSQGGHTNRATGEYHFHHGFPAHQHTDGICPYDYIDKTNTKSAVGGDEAKPPDSHNPPLISLSFVIGLIITLVIYSSGHLILSYKRKKPITSRRLALFSLVYCVTVWLYSNMMYSPIALLDSPPSVFPPIICGFVFHAKAKRILIRRGLLLFPNLNNTDD